MKKLLLYTLPLTIFIGLGILGYSALTTPEVEIAQSPPSIETVPDFDLTGLSADDFAAEPALVNFFASWCAPCEAEHPIITALSDKYPVYGIAFLDEPEKTNAFLDRLGNPFSHVGHDTEGVVAADWGIIGVPTSFVIHGNQILYRHDGPLTEEVMANDILPHMEGLK